MSSSFSCFNDHSGVACCYMPILLFLYNLQRVFVYKLHHFCISFSCMNEIIYYSSSVCASLSLISSFSIEKKNKYKTNPKACIFLEKILKLFQMTRGGKFCFRSKEIVFAVGNLSSFSNNVNLSNGICNLFLPSLQHF